MSSTCSIPGYQELGWPIGSGSVESANKGVVQARLKGAGMRWERSHVNPMLAGAAQPSVTIMGTSFAPGMQPRLLARQERRPLPPADSPGCSSIQAAPAHPAPSAPGFSCSVQDFPSSTRTSSFPASFLSSTASRRPLLTILGAVASSQKNDAHPPFLRRLQMKEGEGIIGSRHSILML